MANKYQLEQELQEYENLKANLNKTVENLGNASESAFKINPGVTANYTINKNPSAVGERADNLAKKISETSNYVRNTIIPAINTKQENIRAEIRRIEEEERRAREEAERRAREAAEERERKAKEAQAKNSSVNRKISGTTFRW